MIKKSLYTKYLFYLCVFGCTFSFVTDEIFDVGKIYPFFSWKLFSQPLGTKNYIEEFRIYSKKNSDSLYHRNAIKKTETFSTDEYVYTLYYFTTKAIKNPQNYKARLYDFCKHVEPDQDNYKIVLESYKPSDLQNIQNKNRYDTTTVVTF